MDDARVRPRDAEEERELVEAARRGERKALEGLFVRTAGGALVYARARLGPALRTEAESLDLVHEAWMEAQTALPGFEWRGVGSFGKWFCRVLENRIRALADRQGAQKRSPPGERESLSAALEQARSSAGPESLAARRESDDRLLAGLLGLDEDERRALLLRHFQEAPVAAIAEDLGRSESAIRRLLASATRNLGRRLGARSGGPA